MQIDPYAIERVERYKMLIGAVVPRPIGWVSTVSQDGAANLAPFSFFNGVSSEPYALLFCPANNADGSEKDSLRNAAPAPSGVGQFVVNVVDEACARRMAITAEGVPFGVSEFGLSGLTPAPSTKVRPPRVAEAPFSFECETIEVVRLAPGAPGGGNVVIGRIVWIHARDGIVDERHRVDPARLAAIGRMAGLGYCTTRQRFELPWGNDAVDEPEINFDARFP